MGSAIVFASSTMGSAWHRDGGGGGGGGGGADDEGRRGEAEEFVEMFGGGVEDH